MNSESSFKQDLQNMDIRLTEMEEKIDAIDKKLTQVVDAILGNPLTKKGGFVEKIEVLEEKIATLEKKIEKHDEFKKRITWTLGIIIALGMLIEYVSKVYSNIK
jgi:hypothetical protein